MARVVECAGCPAMIAANEAIWIGDKPYCDECVPEPKRPDYDVIAKDDDQSLFASSGADQ